MRWLLKATLAVAALVSGSVGLVCGPAYAEPACNQTDPATGICLVWAESPGTPTGSGSDDVNEVSDDAGSADDAPQDSGPGAACFWSGGSQGGPTTGPVPCTSENGYWSNSQQCYITIADPQPGPGDPYWEGAYLDYGAVYECYQPQTDLLILVWSADAPASSGAGPTPREVAQMAVDQMRLKAIDIGITPKPAAGSVGIVGMPVWMWVAGANQDTWGPSTASASAGGITVTATARVHQITWQMGDGTAVTCASAGTAYEASYGSEPSPDCGHVYTTTSSSEQDGKFTVAATSDWVVGWVGAGQSGTIRLDGLTSEVQIAVGEAQVLVQ